MRPWGIGFDKLDIVSVFDRNENLAACHQTQGSKQVIITVQGFTNTPVVSLLQDRDIQLIRSIRVVPG